MKRTAIIIGLVAAAILIALFLLSRTGTGPLPTPVGSAPGTDRSWEQVDALLKDIEAHERKCAAVTPDQATLQRECTGEKAELVARQGKIGIPDEVINEKFARDNPAWRWP
jgi:hypothetical protein